MGACRSTIPIALVTVSGSGQKSWAKPVRMHETGPNVIPIFRLVLMFGNLLDHGDLFCR